MCPSVHFLNIFLPPVPEVGCPNFVEIWNPCGKVWKELVSDLKTFTTKGCKIAAQKKLVFGRILPKTKNLSTNADSRTNTILERLHDLSNSF